MATAHQLSELSLDVSLLAEVTEQRDVAVSLNERLTLQLTAVMRTLAHVCPSDEHRKLYDETWAMLAELGVPMDERWAGFERSYAEWSGKR